MCAVKLIKAFERLSGATEEFRTLNKETRLSYLPQTGSLVVSVQTFSLTGL